MSDVALQQRIRAVKAHGGTVERLQGLRELLRAGYERHEAETIAIGRRSDDVLVWTHAKSTTIHLAPVRLDVVEQFNKPGVYRRAPCGVHGPHHHTYGGYREMSWYLEAIPELTWRPAIEVTCKQCRRIYLDKWKGEIRYDFARAAAYTAGLQGAAWRIPTYNCLVGACEPPCRACT